MEVLNSKPAPHDAPEAVHSHVERADITSKAMPNETPQADAAPTDAPAMTVVKTITKKFEEQPPHVLGLHPSVQAVLRQYDAENKEMQKKIAQNSFAAQQIVQLEINREGIAQGHHKMWTVDRDFLTVEVPQPLVKLED